MDETWTTHALPILNHVAEHEEGPPGRILDVKDMAEALGLDPQRTSHEVARLLEDGYLSGKAGDGSMADASPVADIIGARLAPRGARTVGLWPPDDLGEAFVRLLNERADSEPDPTKKARLRTMASHVADIGKGAVGSMLADLGRYGLLG